VKVVPCPYIGLVVGATAMVALPTMFTMFLAGVWHGAGFQFLIFGVLHGTYLVLNHAWRIFGKEASLIARILHWAPASVGLTFVAVLIGQVFFRSSSSSDACAIIMALCGLRGIGFTALTAMPSHAFLFLFALPVIWLLPNTQEILGRTAEMKSNATTAGTSLFWKPSLPWAGAMGCMLTAVFWFMTDTSSFLYFQF